jgi:hypothetical protein
MKEQHLPDKLLQGIKKAKKKTETQESTFSHHSGFITLWLIKAALAFHSFIYFDACIQCTFNRRSCHFSG